MKHAWEPNTSSKLSDFTHKNHFKILWGIFNQLCSPGRVNGGTIMIDNAMGQELVGNLMRETLE